MWTLTLMLVSEVNRMSTNAMHDHKLDLREMPYGSTNDPRLWHVTCVTGQCGWMGLFGTDTLPTPHGATKGAGDVAAILRELPGNEGINYTWSGSPHAPMSPDSEHHGR